ncbi:MAG: hypothetical protein V3U75_10770 [Methylococcaceae bacterium]
MLREDLEGRGRHLTNPQITEVEGTTGTGLDEVIDIIYTDRGLAKRISTGDMREAAEAADNLNHVVVESINATGASEDGISPEEVLAMTDYIVVNRQAEWIEYHGNDEDDIETGYHLVQGDGAKKKLFGRNAINKIFDGIYHLGFGTNDNARRLINEDGNNNP